MSMYIILILHSDIYMFITIIYFYNKKQSILIITKKYCFIVIYNIAFLLVIFLKKYLYFVIQFSDFNTFMKIDDDTK